MTLVTKVPPLVTVFGGSGFLGRHVVRALARRGYSVRVAVRNPNLAGHLQPLGDVGQIQAVQANLRVRWSVDRAVQGADHVVNLVGILSESGRQTFNAVQDFGARAVAEAARAEGARLTHVSALGISEQSSAAYAQTKMRAERAVLETVGDATIFRPSIMFGPDDRFFNRFAAMSRFSPALPLIGGGMTLLQPVYVADVADAIARSVDGKVEGGKIYELGGPEAKSFRDWLEIMLAVIQRERMLVPVPWPVAGLMGSVLGLLPKPQLTRGQVEMLKTDNVVSQQAEQEGRSFAALGITPQPVDAILPSYLWQFRPAGQFTRPDTA